MLFEGTLKYSEITLTLSLFVAITLRGRKWKKEGERKKKKKQGKKKGRKFERGKEEREKKGRTLCV